MLYWCPIEVLLIFSLIETTLPSGISSISTYDMVKNVHSALRQYGPLRWIRLYWDYSSYPIQSASMRIRAEFSASGVCLIDCPAEARPGAPMKKLLGEFQCKTSESFYSNVSLSRSHSPRMGPFYSTHLRRHNRG